MLPYSEKSRNSLSMMTIPANWNQFAIHPQQTVQRSKQCNAANSATLP
jgi:hypothetical protein